ncbi:hypothetical protein EXU30_03535 [Shewanella maritima]|uniref:Uncharacterized protein n=1 Tax=Shewanella maritima TaxID=2520507 RepID=A0A411PEB2_9GAMM|nr:hypothetical protein [Shewanella maritima]QBF81873.1 hypothetical protein EXU30_03535 [Shewanella maritima]
MNLIEQNNIEEVIKREHFKTDKPLGTVLWVGCGSYPNIKEIIKENFRHIVLVDAQSDVSEQLEKDFAGVDNVTVLNRLVTAKGEPCTFFKASLDKYSGVEVANDLIDLYPNMQITEQHFNKAYKLTELVNEIGMSSREFNTLIIDTPYIEEQLISSLSDEHIAVIDMFYTPSSTLSSASQLHNMTALLNSHCYDNDDAPNVYIKDYWREKAVNLESMVNIEARRSLALQEELSLSLRQIDSLRDKLSAEKAAVSELNEINENALEVYADLESELSNFEKEHQEKLQSFDREVADLQSCLLATRHELNGVIENNIQAHRSEKQALQQTVEYLESKLNKLQQELKSSNKQNSELRDANSALEQKLNDAQAQTQVAIDRVELEAKQELEKVLATYKDKITSGMSEVKSLEGELSQLSAELVSVTSAHQVSEKVNCDLKAQLEKLESEKSQVDSEVQSLNDQLRQSLKENAEYQVQLEETKVLLVNANAETESINSLLASSEEAKEVLATNLEKEKVALAKCTGTNQFLNDELLQVKTISEQAHNHRVEIEENFKEYKLNSEVQAEKLQLEVESLNEQIGDLKLACDSLQQELLSKEHSLAKVNSDLQQLESSYKESKDSIATLEAQTIDTIALADAKIKANGDEVAALNDKVEKAQVRCSALENERSHFQKEIGEYKRAERINQKMLSKAHVDLEDLRAKYAEKADSEAELLELIKELREKLTIASKYYYRLQQEHPELLSNSISEDVI